MRADCRQRLGLALAIIGFLGSIITCAHPTWKITAFIGSNNITTELIFEGLWMYCEVHSTGQIKCQSYTSVLALPQDLQTARALVVITIIMGFFAVFLGVIGDKSIKLQQDERKKSKGAIASGVVFIIAGILVLIPVCWSANTIRNNFYKPFLKLELGTSLYIGWTSAGLLCLGGGLLCSSCPPKGETKYEIKYSKANPHSPNLNSSVNI